MSTEYSDFRISKIICGLFLVVEVVLLIFGLSEKNLGTAIVMIVGVLVVFLLLFSLSVEIAQDTLVIRYGLGLLSKSILLQDIQSTEIVPNAYVTWVYDPQREHVLRVHLRGGGRTIVGIGDPKYMMELIRSLSRR